MIFLDTTWRNVSLRGASQAGLVNNLNDGLTWGVFPLLFASRGLGLAAIGLIKGVYPFDEVASAFQKEIRRGDVRAAMYWGHLLYAEAPYDAWKRLLVAAAEDVGLAAPEAVEKVCGLALAWRICREKSYYVSPHHFSMAVMLLCAAPKDNRVEDLQTLVLDRIKELTKTKDWPPIPEVAVDAHTVRGRAAGRTWRDWYFGRHVTCGVPTNEYTLRLWERKPEWDPRGDHELATEFCTRYVAGEGRHRFQARCPLAPDVPCAPEAS